jgi:glycerol-3-phosphate dehydrogenase (NAD(P)+)
MGMGEKPCGAIVGAGQLGKAVAKLLEGKEVEVRLWDLNPEAVPGERPLQNVLADVRFVFFCVPSGATRAAIAAALPYMKAGTVVVSFAKGVEPERGQTMAEMIPSFLPLEYPFAVAGGPMLADEILAGKDAVGVFASANADTLAEMKALLSGEHFRVETSTDPASVALAGVLKNIYAVAIGIADGLGASENDKGWIVSRALAEMQGIATRFGADPSVMCGTAGLGDLIATGSSARSCNRGVGEKLARGQELDMRGEGLTALPYIIGRLGDEAERFPLLSLIGTVSDGKMPAVALFHSFVSAR